MRPKKMCKVLDGKRYDTEAAEIIADDCYWDGSNFERRGRNTFLYKTPNNGYFAVHQTMWQGEIDRLEPLTVDEAQALWETLPEQNVDFEEAFPGIEVVNA